MPTCVLFVSSTSGIVFNTNAGAFTDCSESAKDVNLYFKYHRQPVLISRNSLSKSGQSASTQQKLISAVGVIRTHNLSIDSLMFDH